MWYLTCMEFTKLLEIVGSEPVFETGLLLSGEVDAADVRRQLSRWKKAGKVYQIRRRLYALAPPFQKVNPHPFFVANRMVQGSYVSLQSALAYYELIPEYVPVTISVTTGRTARWETPLGIYEFHHIQAPFFNGYRLTDLGNDQQTYIATLEKALLDLIYLRPGADSPDYLKEIRLQNLEKLDLKQLGHLVERMDKPKLARAVAWITAQIENEFSEYKTV